MSDLTTSDPTPPPRSSEPAAAREIEVDVAAFLPEGVELGTETVGDEPPPTVASPLTEVAPTIDVEVLSQIERNLDAVDAAIAALDAGTYGINPADGRLIDDGLLAEDPTRLS